MPSTDCTTFTQIAVAAILDQLCEAKDRAVAAAAGDSAWLTAIDSAWGWLLDQTTVEYDAATHTLAVESASEPGKVHLANGRCGCKQFVKAGGACYHRAAARLVRRALELVEAQAAAAEQAELVALAQELLNDARLAGCAWYSFDIALAGARSRLAGLLDYAAEWDQVAAAQRGQSFTALARAA